MEIAQWNEDIIADSGRDEAVHKHFTAKAEDNLGAGTALQQFGVNVNEDPEGRLVEAFQALFPRRPEVAIQEARHRELPTALNAAHVSVAALLQVPLR